MPPDIVLRFTAENLTENDFRQLRRQLLELGGIEERIENDAERRAVSRNRRRQAEARARRAEAEASVQREKSVQAEIRKTEAIQVSHNERAIAQSNERQAASRKEQAEWNAIRADILETGRADTNFTKRYQANQRTRQAELRNTTRLAEKDIAQLRSGDRAVQAATQKFVAAERRKQAEINQTTKAQEAQSRQALESQRQIGRARDREFRREERIARERFIRDQGGAGLGFAAGVGAGLFGRLQQIAGSIAVLSGGFYAANRAFTSVVRDRARVQRLEVGVRDLTDQFRQQAILPRLQEIALLPGLDYVTATSAFTRALSGGFDDQQALRLIDQIRNAVALSQGSIEDTNEVLRQFVQIQARGRFDQENLRPILERAPFIRRVIQAEFGTQIGGEIQQVLDQRGISTTEGILRIVERLAQGPVADPTTLQNALDNVGNELILLRNELGRRIQPLLTNFIDTFTNLLRSAQGPEGQIVSGVGAGAALFGGVGLVRDIIGGRRSTDFNRVYGFDRIARQFPDARGRIFSAAIDAVSLRQSGARGGIGPGSRDALRDFFRDSVGANERLPEISGRIATANREYRELLRQTPILQRFRRGTRRQLRGQAETTAGIDLDDLLIQEALLLNAAGNPSVSRRVSTALFGRRGERLRPFGGFQSPFVRRGRGFGVQSPFRGQFLAPLFSTPGLLAAGAGAFGGTVLSQTALEAAGRGEANTFQEFLVRFGGAAEGLIGSFINLSDRIKQLNEGGLKDFQVLTGTIASEGADLTRQFNELQISTRGRGARLSLDEQRLSANNPVLEEILLRNRTFPESYGLGRDFDRAETRSGTLEFFRERFAFENRLAQAIDQFATERGNVQANIRRLEQNLLSINRPTGEIQRGGVQRGTARFTEEEQERLQEIEQITQELEKQNAELEKIRQQENQIINVARRLRYEYDQIGRENALRLTRLEDFIGTSDSLVDNIARGFSRDGRTVEGIISKEDLENINTINRLLGGTEQTLDDIVDSFREVSNTGRLAFRPVTTALGTLNNVIRNLNPTSVRGRTVADDPATGRINRLIEGIIPPGGRDLPQGRDSTGRPVDIEGAGLRSIIRTDPNLLRNLGTDAENARRRIDEASESYRRIRRQVQEGGPTDPNNPTGILPIPQGSGVLSFGRPGRPSSGTQEVPSIPIIPPRLFRDNLTFDQEVGDTRVTDNINANRRALESLGDEFQDLQRTAETFNRGRGLFDFTRPSRIREIGTLIASTDELRQRFERLRPAIQESIDALPENNPLRQELQRLIDIPVDELTRRINQLRQEITNLSGTGLILQQFRDSFNRLTADALGSRGSRTGVRAFGRQFGNLLGDEINAERGQQILRRRRRERAEAFANYFEGSAESLYDEFLAPSLLDAIGIGSGQSAAQERALQRLARDVDEQRREVRENDTLNERQRVEELLEINREYQREKRELERSYEEQRSDAWANWVRQQLTDFPKLIFQQLNLQLAARATNFILNSIGLGGGIPITGPGIGGTARALGNAGGLGAPATAAVAFSGYQAGRGIYSNAAGGGYNDIFQDIANIPSSIGSFFSNLSFHDPINDAFAFEVGRARSQQAAARLGRESARDIVRNYDEGFQEGSGQISLNRPQSDQPIIFQLQLNDRTIQEFHYAMNELESVNRL